MVSKKRRCLFCNSLNLSKEHIYPAWLFKTLKTNSPTFKPSNLLRVSEVTEFEESLLFSSNDSDNREIRYDDFTIKSVCKECNSGWMSELETATEKIITNILKKEKSLLLPPEEALVISKWAILKSILLVQATQSKIDLDETILKQIKDGIISEGFIVEITELTDNNLNYATGNVAPPILENLTNQDFELVIDSFFLVAFQIGEIGFRISHFRSTIPIFRAQLVKELFVLYPYMSKLPFKKEFTVVLEKESKEILAVNDFNGVEELRNTLVLCG